MTPSHSPTDTSLLKLFGIPERLIGLVDYDVALRRLLAIVFHKKSIQGYFLGRTPLGCNWCQIIIAKKLVIDFDIMPSLAVFFATAFRVVFFG